MINKIENISNLFDFANSTVYKWKKERRLILDLMDKYFTDEDIEEFIQTGKIKKFEDISDLEALNNEAVNIYSSFILRLNSSSLLLFLTVIHTSYINNQDINSNFIELIFDTFVQKEDKINLINEFQKIQNSTLFFYAIKYLVKNKFSEVYTYLNNERKENLELKIKHLQAYLSIFLNKNYDSYNFYLHGIDEETEHLNIDNLIKQKSVFFDYEEDYLGHYYNYLFNLTFSKEDYIYKSIKIISN